MRVNSFSSHQTLLCPIASFPLFELHKESLSLMYYYFLKIHLLLSIPFLTLCRLFFVTGMFFDLTSIRLVNCRILCILKDSFKQTLSSFPPLLYHYCMGSTIMYLLLWILVYIYFPRFLVIKLLVSFVFLLAATHCRYIKYDF